MTRRCCICHVTCVTFTPVFVTVFGIGIWALLCSLAGLADILLDSHSARQNRVKGQKVGFLFVCLLA